MCMASLGICNDYVAAVEMEGSGAPAHTLLLNSTFGSGSDCSGVRSASGNGRSPYQGICSGLLISMHWEAFLALCGPQAARYNEND